MISTGKGVEKILARKRRRSGKKGPAGKGGKDLRKEAGEGLSKGKASERVGRISTGKGGTILGRKREKIWKGPRKGSQQGKGAKDLREESGEDLSGGKGLRGERGNGSQQGTGGGKLLGRKREKISGGKDCTGERGERISAGKGGERSEGGKGEDLGTSGGKEET